MINSVALEQTLQPQPSKVSGYAALAAMRLNPAIKMSFFLTEEAGNFHAWWYEKGYPVMLLGIFGNIDEALSCGESKLYSIRVHHTKGVKA